MRKSIILPGWMSRVKNYRMGEGSDIWEEFGDPMKLPEAEYIVCHSLGCHYALSNWQNGRDNKLILVNPPIFKRNIFAWAWRWLRYLAAEGPGVSFHDIGAKEIIAGIKNCQKLMQPDFRIVLKKLPKENLTIIRGKNDNYFCDREVADFARAENIRLIEVADCGHNWCGGLKNEVLKIIGDEKS